MTILEQILAGLQQKFAGVDTAILTRIATKKAEGVTDETKVNSIVEGISFSDVLNSYGDFRAGDASKTAVTTTGIPTIEIMSNWRVLFRICINPISASSSKSC